MSKPYEEAFQIVFARLFDFAALNTHIFEFDFFLRNELLDVETYALDIGYDFLRPFLEHHEYASFAVLRGAAHKELHGEHCFAAACRPADKRRSSLRQAALGDFIQSLDARP